MKYPLAAQGKTGRMGRFDLRGKLIFTLAFTLAHMLLSILLFGLSFSAVMSNADDGKPLPLGDAILYHASQVLLWPIVIPLGRVEYLREVLPVYSGIFILFLNSLTWAIIALAIMLGIRYFRARK